MTRQEQIEQEAKRVAQRKWENKVIKSTEERTTYELAFNDGARWADKSYFPEKFLPEGNNDKGEIEPIQYHKIVLEIVADIYSRASQKVLDRVDKRVSLLVMKRIINVLFHHEYSISLKVAEDLLNKATKEAPVEN